ncbi:pyridoxal-phosphate dependent enzyme [bacterium]|nr:pyridoxal-phosphate dependent enzyme [candidate division CSSED10-310 bacterium]
MNRLPLFETFPGLDVAIPHHHILRGPTPVSQAVTLGRRLGRDDLWIKHDDLTAEPYGGNKPRKLDFLLADAARRGAESILTTGGIGSNHCLATIVYGRSICQEVHLLLFPQPITEHVRMSLALFSKLGAVIHPGRGYEEQNDLIEALLAAHSGMYFIPAGGSNALGSLGFLNAGLELARQVRDGVLPEPAAIYIAAGTSGSMAGLIAGCLLAGMRTRVIGVRVVDSVVTNPQTVLNLIHGMFDLLSQATGSFHPPEVKDNDIILEDAFLGAGYGAPTETGRNAAELFHDQEGIQLEPTYTAKTAAAFLAAARSAARGPLLFWNTFAGSVLSDLVTVSDLRGLPAFLRTLLNEGI